jgi:hypothetical protein
MEKSKIAVVVTRATRGRGRGYRERVYLAHVPVSADGAPEIPAAFRLDVCNEKYAFARRSYFISATAQARRLWLYAESLADKVNVGEMNFAAASAKFCDANEYLDPADQDAYIADIEARRARGVVSV